MEEKQLYLSEVCPGVWLMDEAHEATGYLVVGSERACVIDTMNRLYGSGQGCPLRHGQVGHRDQHPRTPGPHLRQHLF